MRGSIGRAGAQHKYREARIMSILRRTILRGVAVLPFATFGLRLGAAALSNPDVSAAAAIPPIHQSGAGSTRSSRDGLSSARLWREIQIHCRARAGLCRDHAGTGGQAQRPRHRHAGKRADQSAGRRRIRRDLPRSRLIPANASAAPFIPPGPPRTGAGVRRRWTLSWYLEIVLTAAGQPPCIFAVTALGRCAAPSCGASHWIRPGLFPPAKPQAEAPS
jgi:hypothetical protein